MALGRDELERGLAAACARELGEGELAGLRRLTGGASQQTWSFDWTRTGDGGDASLELILRRNVRPQLQSFPVATEFALLDAARAMGVPAPRAHFLLRDRDGLGHGYVMERIEGETIPRKILRDDRFAAARPRIAAQAGEILARIHEIDFASVDGLSAPEPDSNTTMRAIAKQRALIDQFGEPHPVFELALRWLEDEMPASVPDALVHGDYRLGNFIVGEEGIRSILDWELAHVGDPIEDLGWLCVKAWRFGRNDRPVAGVGEIDALCDAYEGAGGKGADPDRVRYWIVYGTLRWGVICQAQAFAHRSGISRSVELAAIGRRVCETEWDLLQLIG